MQYTSRRRIPIIQSIPSARVYYIRLALPSGLTLYKIGYTRMSIRQRVYGYYTRASRKAGQRLGGMGVPSGTLVTIVSILYKGLPKTAYTLEQNLHRRYQSYRYTGPAVLANGNTELYSSDILKLDI